MHNMADSNVCFFMNRVAAMLAHVTGTAALLVHALQGQWQCMFMHNKDSSNACSCMTRTAAMLAQVVTGTATLLVYA